MHGVNHGVVSVLALSRIVYTLQLGARKCLALAKISTPHTHKNFTAALN